MPSKKPPTPARAALGERIAAARRHAGLNQPQLARALGVSVQSLQQWETGRTSPSLLRFADLAALLNVSIGELMGESFAAILDQRDRDRAESAFLSLYRQLSPDARQQVRQLCEYLYAQEQRRHRPKKK